MGIGPAVGVAAGVVLGVVLAWAGAVKLVDLPAWRAAAAAFGTPSWAVGAVPPVELVLGATLAAGVARPWPALGAAALLAVFTGAVAVRLATGRRTPCACFGGRSVRPLSGWTLTRNVVLLALAVTSALLAGT